MSQALAASSAPVTFGQRPERSVSAYCMYQFAMPQYLCPVARPNPDKKIFASASALQLEILPYWPWLVYSPNANSCGLLTYAGAT